jgi:hypothetical protein
MADGDAAPGDSSAAGTVEELQASGNFSLVPLYADEYESKCLPLVPELRARLAGALPDGSVLWGAELLNADDAAGTHVLAKCAPSRPAGKHPGGHGPNNSRGCPCPLSVTGLGTALRLSAPARACSHSPAFVLPPHPQVPPRS